LSILCWKTESNGQASGCGTACNAYALTDKTEHQRLLGLAAGLSRVWPLDSIFKMGEPPHCQQVAQSLDDSLPFVIRSLSRPSLFSVYKPREIADTVLSPCGLREEIGCRLGGATDAFEVLVWVTSSLSLGRPANWFRHRLLSLRTRRRTRLRRGHGFHHR